MKIGILTFHKGYNHGGFFQALGTQIVLNELGYDAEIIDYTNPHHKRAEAFYMIRVKSPLRLIQRIRKILAFHKDFKTLKLSGKKQINSYDAIVIGSDIVWNYQWDFLGNDPIYFGQGLSSPKLIAYAPSFGDIQYSKEMDIPAYVSSGISKFSSISTRDSNSAKIVEGITKSFPPQVIDPVFFLPKSILTTKRLSPSKYLLIYAFHVPQDMIPEILKFAIENGLKTICVGYHHTWCDVDKSHIGPYSWLGYFEHADYVVTSTFHGTLFSIIYQKQFCTLPNSAINNKLETILSKTDLSSQMISIPSAFGSILTKRINYSKITKELTAFRDMSINYLTEALHD